MWERFVQILKYLFFSRKSPTRRHGGISEMHKTKEVKERNKDESKRKKFSRSSSSKDRKSISSHSINDDRELDKKNLAEDKRKNKNIIKISESLELEKNFGVKKEKDRNREKVWILLI